MFCLFFLVAGGSVHSDLLWLLCPFGVGCQLSGSQGGGISDSASRGKGDFPFPHEDRRDVTVWRLYVFFIAVGWTAAASAGQAPLSLPGSCLPGSCRRSATYGYGRLRLSDAGRQGKNNCYSNKLYYFCKSNTIIFLIFAFRRLKIQ